MDRSIIEQYIEEKNKQIEEKELLKKQREEEIEQAKKDAYQQQKRDFLYSEGIYEIEYSKDGKESEEYQEYDYDQTTGEFKFYKYVFPEISDEEYEQLKALKEKAEGREEKKVATNKLDTPLISKILLYIGTSIFVGGIFLAFITLVTWLDDFALNDFAVEAFFVILGTSFTEFAFFWGFAEIIKLLNDIKNK